MKKILKIFLSYTLKPYLKYVYLSSKRSFRYSNLSLKVEPSVFHPGLFYSSKLFAQFIETLEINQHSLLDIGCGSGLLSLLAAKNGAKVTAIDINQAAVKNTQQNAIDNHLDITCIHSDMFEQIEGCFDYIVVNPPYYPKTPQSKADHAWYCGESHLYFERFFSELSHYYHDKSKIYMILSDECNLDKIKQIAGQYDYRFEVMVEKSFILEKNFIYKISK